MRTTEEHFGIILDYSEHHSELITNKFVGARGKENLHRQWQELVDVLNALQTETRTVKQWKQVVADWKCRVKKQYAELKKDFTATGGGVPVMENLTDQEIRLLNIMGMTAADGDEGLQEYGLEFEETDEVIEVLSAEDTESPGTSQNKRPRSASLPNHSESSSQRARLSSELVDSISEMNNKSLSVLNDINGNLKRIADCLEIIVKRAFPE
ncbi:uncharacterized protein LOC112459355 [Temnothorax curvispinosus]|uniref:Regulatory protein zeste n=1 Tax=Temnothorax curvispinosus TaxID=300111 RepID=A0A6J1QA28_9HYME|nr:uncharacterized protein LOC112459355 [Temnothorax curvispinosus]